MKVKGKVYVCFREEKIKINEANEKEQSIYGAMVKKY